jgi:O-antigen/teichoic acid export membrane protein
LILRLYSKNKKDIKALLGSRFALDALNLFVLNLISKLILFFGNAYSAKCLGPLFFGTSALVLTTAQQVALTFNGGFDVVGVREIAADKQGAAYYAKKIIRFRFAVALVVTAIWLIFTHAFAGDSDKFPWLMGAGILLLTSLNMNFVFQGLEKLPYQTAVSAGGSLVTAGVFFALFYPGIFLGSDLAVTFGVLGLTVGLSAFIFFRLLRIRGEREIGKSYAELFMESWRYWILAIVVYFYSIFQIPLIAYFKGNEEAGIYRSAFMMAGGLELLFNSITSLLLPRLVAWKERGGGDYMWSRQKKLFYLFLLVGLPLILLLFFFSGFIFKSLLGEAYSDGANVFRILIFGRLIVFLGQIYAWGLAAVKLDKEFLKASIFGSIFSVALSLILVPMYGILAAASISLGSEALVHILCFLYLRNNVKKLNLEAKI